MPSVHINVWMRSGSTITECICSNPWGKYLEVMSPKNQVQVTSRYYDFAERSFSVKLVPMGSSAIIKACYTRVMMGPRGYLPASVSRSSRTIWRAVGTICWTTSLLDGLDIGITLLYSLLLGPSKLWVGARWLRRSKGIVRFVRLQTTMNHVVLSKDDEPAPDLGWMERKTACKSG